MIVDRLMRVALVGSSWILYLLFFLSVVSIAAMVDRWLFFRKRSGDVDALRKSLKDKLRAGDLDGAESVLAASRSIEAEVLRGALAWRHGGAEAVADALESESARVRKELERNLNLLGTLGNNAPFVGLLGTVLGVIEAFHQLADTQNKAAMGNVMSGISEALIATGVGLFVALPAVVAYNVVQKKIGDIESTTAGLGKLLTAALKTEARKLADLPAAEAASSMEEPVKKPVSRKSNGAAAAAES